ncbi:uncharacterized protein H6S33_007610 [Morchella sextelata]|uniref:uncharacterized protein n=1 Tax=Morchella sextelata TaxID=1174677 RepID=UPI001D04295C|nr:uncharacterized protein H6S33_007610 [Morchella sextelata]KAH0603288.1 hypothetical protein H6S33_007610 [Morchella sextelata]
MQTTEPGAISPYCHTSRNNSYPIPDHHPIPSVTTQVPTNSHKHPYNTHTLPSTALHSERYISKTGRPVNVGKTVRHHVRDSGSLEVGVVRVTGCGHKCSKARTLLSVDILTLPQYRKFDLPCSVPDGREFSWMTTRITAPT